METLARLVGDDLPLVTITGSPGVGKSMLIRAFLRLHEGASRKRVFCTVEAARDAQALRETVIRALGGASRHREDASGASFRRAFASLGPVLLVLDGADRVLPDVRTRVSEWVETIPELQIVVTSRERLHVPLEQVLPLQPFPVPAEGEPPGGAALELWTARMRERDARYTLDGPDAGSTVALLRGLDGLPLAIELAAARSATMAPRELLRRLAGSRDILGLAQTLDLSWQLLDSFERKALARCSTFAGRISLEAAEAVIRDADAEGPPVVEVLSRLRDKSLLSFSLLENGEGELTMLACVRAFAERKLADSERANDAARRYAAFFVREAQSIAALACTDPHGAARAFEAEHDNFIAVVRRSIEAADQPSIENALHILVALESPRWFLDEPSANLELFDRALERASGADSRLLIHARIARGRVAWRAGRLDTTESDLEAALNLAESLDDVPLRSLSERFLALPRLLRGRFDDARELATDALALARSCDDRGLEALALAMLGYVLRFSGEPVRARGCLEEAIAAFISVRDVRLLQSLRIDIVFSYLDAGDTAAAKLYAQQLRDDEREPALLARLSVALGHAALVEGDSSAARHHYTIAREHACEAGDRVMEVVALACGAVARFELGEIVAARVQLHELVPATIQFGPNLYSGLLQATGSVFDAAAGQLEDPRGVLDDVARALHLPLRSSTIESKILERILRALRDSYVDCNAEGRAHRVLRIEADGAWFEPPGGSRVACRERRVMRRLLLALTRAHEDRPGTRLTNADLIEAGWPGERVKAEAGRNRLHVMIARMRDLGLRGVLDGDGSGYRLAEDIRLEVVGRA